MSNEERDAGFQNPDKSETVMALEAVALFFVVFGWLTAVAMVWDFLHGRITFSAGLLGIWIGPGLKRRSTGWRTAGLVVLWLGFIFTGFALLLLLFSRNVRVDYAGGIFGPLGGVVTLIYFALSIWACATLCRPEVRKLFGA